MMCQSLLRRMFVLAMPVLLVSMTIPATAAVPEPKSGGKFERGRGTKTEPQYEQKQEKAPLYEYGGGLHYGPFHIKPSAQYVHEWDDNIFLEHTDEKEDIISKLLLGVTNETPFHGGQHLVSASYNSEFNWFHRFQNQDHTDHEARGGLNLNFTPFTLAIEDLFRRTVNRADTEFTGRVRRDENTVQALLEIPFARFFLETAVDDYDIDYRAPDNRVFDHHIATVYQRVGFDVAPSTQVLAEYGYTNINYSNADERDGDANQVSLGVRGYLGERVTYQAWGGVQQRIYDVDSRPDYHGLIARSALQYDLSEVNYILLKASRAPQESTFDGQSFYVRDRAELKWYHQIAERFFLTATEQVDYNEYSRRTEDRLGETKTRRDWLWNQGVGAEYFMPNGLVSFFGEYKFRSRDSNLLQLDYEGSIIRAGVKANF